MLMCLNDRRPCQRPRCPTCTRWLPAHVVAAPAPTIEQTAQGPQLIIPGGERSAHQADASRDAGGHGRIAPKKPQQQPGGLFAPRTAPQPGLFDE